MRIQGKIRLAKERSGSLREYSSKRVTERVYRRFAQCVLSRAGYTPNTTASYRLGRSRSPKMQSIPLSYKRHTVCACAHCRLRAEITFHAVIFRGCGGGVGVYRKQAFKPYVCEQHHLYSVHVSVFS